MTASLPGTGLLSGKGTIVTGTMHSQHAEGTLENYCAFTGTNFLGTMCAASIRCNAIAPGSTASETNRKAPSEIFAAMCAKAPLGRAADPEGQAQVAAFLVSDRASYISGQTLVVDGAWSARLV